MVTAAGVSRDSETNHPARPLQYTPPQLRPQGKNAQRVASSRSSGYHERKGGNTMGNLAIESKETTRPASPHLRIGLIAIGIAAGYVATVLILG